MFFDNSEDNYDFVVFLHDLIIDNSGGAKGIHDEKLIKSALGRPQHSVFGRFAYPTKIKKAAAMLDSLANNHGFRDGNKRTAMAAAVVWLSLNGVNIDFTDKEYEDFMLYVVNNKPSVAEIAKWLNDHRRSE